MLELIKFANQNNLCLHEDTIWGDCNGFEYCLKKFGSIKLLTIYAKASAPLQLESITRAKAGKVVVQSKNIKFYLVPDLKIDSSFLAFIDQLTTILKDTNASKVKAMPLTALPVTLATIQFFERQNKRSNTRYAGLFLLAIITFVLEYFSEKYMINAAEMNIKFVILMLLPSVSLFSFFIYSWKNDPIAVKEFLGDLESRSFLSSNSILMLSLVFGMVLYSSISALVILNCELDRDKPEIVRYYITESETGDCRILVAEGLSQFEVCEGSNKLPVGKYALAKLGQGKFGIPWLAELVVEIDKGQ